MVDWCSALFLTLQCKNLNSVDTSSTCLRRKRLTRYGVLVGPNTIYLLAPLAKPFLESITVINHQIIIFPSRGCVHSRASWSVPRIYNTR